LTCKRRCLDEKQKTDLAEHLEAFHHVGLLVIEPPGTAWLPFNSSSDEFISPLQVRTEIGKRSAAH
jgi:hypothetical protein